MVYNLNFYIRKDYMLKQKTNSRRGFTIIEVVLVLAIAGLIFLMVFLALPALQRSQRDTQRRSAYSEFLTQVSNYQSNNRGRLPAADVSSWEGFIQSYMRPTEVCNRDTSSTAEIPEYVGDSYGKNDCADKNHPNTFLDPIGEPYYIKEVYDFTNPAVNVDAANGTLTWDSNKYQIYVYNGATCDGEKAVRSDGTRNVAIRARLEGGGIYCGNN